MDGRDRGLNRCRLLHTIPAAEDIGALYYVTAGAEQWSMRKDLYFQCLLEYKAKERRKGKKEWNGRAFLSLSLKR